MKKGKPTEPQITSYGIHDRNGVFKNTQIAPPPPAPTEPNIEFKIDFLNLVDEIRDRENSSKKDGGPDA